MKDQQVVERPARGRGGGALLSDERLARRAARADERAFTVIFERYSQEIYRFCLSLLGNTEDARDALQNTMVKALQALPGERRTVELRPWLYRVAHNQSIDMLRSRKGTWPLDPELADPADGLAESSARRERLRQLLGDLRQLPERQRAALLMREMGGLELSQIAEALGSSPAVARQTIYEARLSLRGLEAGREMSCAETMRRLSNADGRVARRRDIQSHLRACPECRAFRDSIEARRQDLAALAPLPAVASAGILHAILGGGAGVASGTATAGGAGIAVGGAGKAITAGLLAKSVATVAVVAAIGVSAANRSGLIDVHPLGGSGASTERATVPPQGAATVPAAAAGSQSANGDGNDSNARDEGKSEGDAKHQKDGGHDPATGAPGAHGDAPLAATHGRETAAGHGGGSVHSGQGHEGRGASHRASGRGSSHPHGRNHVKSSQGSAQGHANGASSTPKQPSGEGGKSPPGSGDDESPSKAEKTKPEAKTHASESSP